MFLYLASPYSHKDKKVVLERFEQTEEALAKLLRRGMTVYSPIVHCHALATKFGLPTDAEYWQRYNHRFLSVCRKLLVLQIDGWSTSLGVNDEIRYADIHHKPIVYLNPASIDSHTLEDYLA